MSLPGAGSAGLRALTAGALLGLAGTPAGVVLAQPTPGTASQPAETQPADEITRGLPELEPEGPYDGRFVRSVTILVRPVGETEFRPADGSIGQLIENQIRTGKGAREYNGRIVADDLVRLNRLGRFSSVEHAVTELEDGSVDVIYRLSEQPIIRDVQITGNRRLGSARLRDAITMIPGTPVDEFELDRAARRIEEIYRDRGYYLADVRVNTDELGETGVVLFEVREGTRVKITDIRFDGNDSFRSGQLRDEIGTREAGFFARGPLDRRQLQEDANAVARYYQDRGYLDARVDFFVQPSPDGREAIITFYVIEGDLYSLRSVIARHTDAEAEGPVLTAEEIVGIAGIKPGDTFSSRQVDAAVRAVRDAYGKMGYVDASVRRQELRDTTRPAVDLLLTITEGDRYRTGLVQITGNTLTKHSEIRSKMKVRPDRPLDTTALDESQRIVAGSRLFDTSPQGAPRTAIQQPRPEQPHHRDVLMEVNETNTGLLSIGASVNSDAGLQGRISYQQRNFDITDWPDSFGDLFSGRSLRGGGQTLTLSASPGIEIQQYELSLADNSINDSFVGGSIGGGFQSRIFNEFSTERLFFRSGLSRRFGDRWVSGLDFRWQSVRQFDLEPSSTTEAFEFEGTNQLTGIGFDLRRTTVPPAEQFRPTRGSITRLGVEQVGVLGGDFDYTRFSADHSVFLSIREDFAGNNTVLRLSTSSDYIPQGQDEVPTYERFYLGGRTMRGLDFRTVSPKGIRADNGEPGDSVGGTFSFFLGAEIQQPVLSENLALAFFVDSGTVTREIGLSAYRVTTGLGLRLYVPQLSPAPLAFDFGVPIFKENSDERRLFTFSVDLPL